MGFVNLGIMQVLDYTITGSIAENKSGQSSYEDALWVDIDVTVEQYAYQFVVADGTVYYVLDDIIGTYVYTFGEVGRTPQWKIGSIRHDHCP